MLCSQTRIDSSSDNRIGHQFRGEAVDYPSSRCHYFQSSPVCYKVPQGRIQYLEIDEGKQQCDTNCEPSGYEQAVRVQSCSQVPRTNSNIWVQNCPCQNRWSKVYALLLFSFASDTNMYFVARIGRWLKYWWADVGLRRVSASPPIYI